MIEILSRFQYPNIDISVFGRSLPLDLVHEFVVVYLKNIGHKVSTNLPSKFLLLVRGHHIRVSSAQDAMIDGVLLWNLLEHHSLLRAGPFSFDRSLSGFFLLLLHFHRSDLILKLFLLEILLELIEVFRVEVLKLRLLKF